MMARLVRVRMIQSDMARERRGGVTSLWECLVCCCLILIFKPRTVIYWEANTANIKLTGRGNMFADVGEEGTFRIAPWNNYQSGNLINFYVPDGHIVCSKSV